MPTFRIKCAETTTEVEAPTLTAALRLARVRPEAVTQVQIVVNPPSVTMDLPPFPEA